MNVRDDLADAHRLAWEHVARPGSWWTGAQRIELAVTALLAIADDDPLPPWVAVTLSEKLPIDRLAPDFAHDAVYRIARHAGTMVDDVYRLFADELGELANELQWYRWNAYEPEVGWSLQLAIEDPANGVAWALTALDQD